jgi:hypothetical protein
MKKLLIISPHFPPVNTADMHRVRQSLPYFRKMGWDPTVVCVDPVFVDSGQDELLNQTFPDNIEVIKVKAYRPEQTRKFGLGNLGYRSLLQYRKTVNNLLRKQKFDLIYFSTTAFPVMVLGRIWKRKFKIPYVIDMQDPWRNDFYLDKPKSERPPKFFIAYRMDKYMEAFAMKKVDGIVSVSPGYPKMLSERYSNVRKKKSLVLPFAGASVDFEVASKNNLRNPFFDKDDKSEIRLVYIGRGGHDLQLAIKAMFSGLKMGLDKHMQKFERIRMFFVGTSYARAGTGKKTIEPIAEKYNVSSHVTEITDRIPYFNTLKVLSDADILIVPGSTDTNYTASKIYPYILAKKPLIAVFNKNSTVNTILAKTGAGKLVPFLNDDNPEDVGVSFQETLSEMLNHIPFIPDTNWEEFNVYSAEEATKKQVEYFNEIIST